MITDVPRFNFPSHLSLTPQIGKGIRNIPIESITTKIYDRVCFGLTQSAASYADIARIMDLNDEGYSVGEIAEELKNRYGLYVP